MTFDLNKTGSFFIVSYVNEEGHSESMKIQARCMSAALKEAHELLPASTEICKIDHATNCP
jgi:hypothetical protein